MTREMLLYLIVVFMSQPSLNIAPCPVNSMAPVSDVSRLEPSMILCSNVLPIAISFGMIVSASIA